jgi:hypothetical protein
MPYTLGTDANRGATGVNCAGGGSFVGTAYNVTFPVVANGFSITIQNCLNDSAASCYGATPDPVNNPEVQLNGSVVPAQISTG